MAGTIIKGAVSVVKGMRGLVEQAEIKTAAKNIILWRLHGVIFIFTVSYLWFSSSSLIALSSALFIFGCSQGK